MSWDVKLVKPAWNCESIEALDEANCVPFNVGIAVTVIKEMFNICDSEEDTWLVYDGDTYAISFHIHEGGVMLFISILDEPTDAVMTPIRELCKALECRAIDMTAAEFIV